MAQWANVNRPLTAGILAQFTPLDRALILTMHRARYSEASDARLLPPLIEAALRYSLIKKPVNVSEVFAPSVWTG